ncbi:acyl-CoA dehydrogenase family protein [Nocardia miyunensis]|uniref:acyl-CoA dehydrogenase family protein n=1 Tax=Nocardia miyunensis TaxID=282684 RepID=UPI00082CB31A|nr:acyl-CoA dehydrogenase family protein [Nocardia miyunensis]
MTTVTQWTIAPPEPDLTPEELVRRARELRPQLLAEQAATDERGTYSPEMHEKFRDAGFYRIFVPRRFGGYEFDMTTYVRVIMEIARGCPGSAWCLALASAHAVQLSSWFSESAQIEALSPTGEFGSPTRGIPRGTAERVDGGWRIEGTWDYCSGSPYSTHAMLWARVIDSAAPADAAPEIRLALVPRSGWTMLDDWRGRAFGMRGSGSNSIRVDGAVVPDHFVIADPFPFSPEAETPGYLLHGNPLYTVKPALMLPLEITAVLIGCARAALDEYERILTKKKAPDNVHAGQASGLAEEGAGKAPATLNLNRDYQRWFGLASGRVAAAERLLLDLSARMTQICEEATRDGKGYSWPDIVEFGLMRQQTLNLGWEAVELMFRTSGTSQGGNRESRMSRYYRDYSMGRTNVMVDEEKFSEIFAQSYFAERA